MLTNPVQTFAAIVLVVAGLAVGMTGNPLSGATIVACLLIAAGFVIALRLLPADDGDDVIELVVAEQRAAAAETRARAAEHAADATHRTAAALTAYATGAPATDAMRLYRAA